MSRRPALLLTLAGALVLRLSTWGHVFSRGRVFIDEPDGYYHLRRAFLALTTWPWVPQVDPALNWTRTGLISWPPLFDGLLATLAMPFGTAAALERIGALLPPILGVLQLGVLYALVRRLCNERAALVATLVAAVLPGVVRYTMVGALDHDPFFELALLVAFYGVASASAALVAIGLATAMLGWTGAIIAAVLVVLVVLVTRREEQARAVALGCAAAALVVAPFVLTSVWHGDTFEGLSWLHVASLSGASFITSLFSRRTRWLSFASGAATLFLAPAAVLPFLHGAAYAAGDAPILAMVAEARPLMTLLGRFDLWPLLIRFGALPLIAFPVVLLAWRRRQD